MMLSTLFLAPLFFRCTAVSARTEQNSGTVSSVGTSLFTSRAPSTRGISLVSVPSRPSFLSVHSSTAVCALLFRGHTLRRFQALSVVPASGHAVLRNIVVRAREILISVQRGLLETSHRLRCENASPGFSTRATLDDSPHRH